MFVWLDNLRRFRARRLVSLLVLVSFCASFVPLPVASRSPVEKDQSAAYPCQNRPCGCQSAEACWKGCCCFTNQEKVAWAEANGVTPPTYVIAAAARESADSVCKAGGCCSKTKSAKASELIPTASKTKGCCSSSHSQPANVPAVKATEEESETQFVIGVFVQKCQGQGLFWNSLPWAILPEVQAGLIHADPVVWSVPVSLTAPARAVEPPEPPPRVVSAATAIV
ncbi:hypothetical protein [Gimesia fumaroli]|uniref:Uncharacterized protein n=1 Tax=Gimesia fumaroli TaxID=2527976 RepID=A0A518I7K2_9PLAN|nr:hypothetical protein [Gimesia fumaroli]QDV49050.1 hypothetical protein Enr17x_10650 [Gimesia fumaroli]